MRSRVAAERAEFAAPPTSADASSVLVVMDTIILDHPKLLGTGDIRHDRRHSLPLSQSLDLTLVQATDLNHYSFFLRWSYRNVVNHFTTTDNAATDNEVASHHRSGGCSGVFRHRRLAQDRTSTRLN